MRISARSTFAAIRSFLRILQSTQVTTIKSTSSAGFTLIELLTVIAIISILATVVLLAVNPAQRFAEAQDAQRKSDLAQIRDALEAYATQHNGQYPSTVSGATIQKWCDGCTHSNPGIWVNVMPKGSDNWIPNLVAEGYLKHLPTDPTNQPNASAIAGGFSDYASYVYTSSGTNYKLMAYGTPQTGFNDPPPPSPFCTAVNGNLQSETGLKGLVDPARQYWGYAVYSNHSYSGNASACW